MAKKIRICSPNRDLMDMTAEPRFWPDVSATQALR